MSRTVLFDNIYPISFLINNNLHIFIKFQYNQTPDVCKLEALLKGYTDTAKYTYEDTNGSISLEGTPKQQPPTSIDFEFLQGLHFWSYINIHTSHGFG